MGNVYNSHTKLLRHVLSYFLLIIEINSSLIVTCVQSETISTNTWRVVITKDEIDLAPITIINENTTSLCVSENNGEDKYNDL